MAWGIARVCCPAQANAPPLPSRRSATLRATTRAAAVWPPPPGAPAELSPGPPRAARPARVCRTATRPIARPARAPNSGTLRGSCVSTLAACPPPRWRCSGSGVARAAVSARQCGVGSPRDHRLTTAHSHRRCAWHGDGSGVGSGGGAAQAPGRGTGSGMGRESTVAGIRWRRLGGGVGSGDGSGGDVWAVASRQWRRLWRWSGQRRCSGSGVTAASLGRWGRLGGCVRSARTAGRESAWVVASSGAVAVIGEDRG